MLWNSTAWPGIGNVLKCDAEDMNSLEKPSLRTDVSGGAERRHCPAWKGKGIVLRGKARESHGNDLRGFAVEM